LTPKSKQGVQPANPASEPYTAARPDGRVVKVSEIVARSILEDILARQLKPGDKLPPESVMVEHFGVGRSSLREALRILEVYGLLTIRPGPRGGPVLRDMGPRDFARLTSFYLHVTGVTFGDLESTLMLVEVALVRQAALVRDPVQIARMTASLAPANNPKLLGQELREFHAAMVAVPGAALLSSFCEALTETVALRIKDAVPLDQALQGMDEHQEILDAISAGDADRAGEIVARHRERLTETYKEVVPTYGDEPIIWAR
jgi:GntR family transcriptional repressor for pyruvate dehydrogenase complex